MTQCADCEKALGIFGGIDVNGELICKECKRKRTEQEAAKRAADEAAAAKAEYEKNEAIKSVLVTTETQPKIVIKSRLGVISAEVAYGMNVFKDIFSSVRNIVGGRSETIQKTMRESRETVLFELKKEARSIGANAVIAIDWDYTQIGESGWNMVLVVATGTAVITEENP